MLDIKLFREDADLIRKSEVKRGHDTKAVDDVIKFDKSWRTSLKKVELLRKQRNAVSAEINQLKKQGKSATAKIKEMKKVADDMIVIPEKSCDDIISENPDYQPMSDTKLIEEYVEKVIAENPQSIADYKAGKTKAFAYLVGQVMKLSRGKAPPPIVNDLLKKHID